MGWVEVDGSGNGWMWGWLPVEGGLAKSFLNMGDVPMTPLCLSILLSGDTEYFLRSLLPPPPTVPVEKMCGRWVRVGTAI